MEGLLVIGVVGLGVLLLFSGNALQPNARQITVVIPDDPERASFGIWGVLILVLFIALLFSSSNGL